MSHRRFRRGGDAQDDEFFIDANRIWIDPSLVSAKADCVRL
jgi:hypothetical protein